MPGDFAAILREPLTITVAGTLIQIPYRPAAVWAKALDEMGKRPVAATLMDQDARELLAELLMTHHPVAKEDLKRESLRILGEAAGRRWWETGRLISTSVGPEVLGRLVLAGVDPWTRSVGEWCAAVYALCVKGQDEKGRIRFDFSLQVPPPGYDDEWDDEGEDPAVVAAHLAKMTGKK